MQHRICRHVLQLSERRALTAYVERISQDVFSTQLPKAPAIMTAEWAQRAEEAAAPSSTRCWQEAVFQIVLQNYAREMGCAYICVWPAGTPGCMDLC